MASPIDTWPEAKEAARRLLDEVGLQNYRFDVEPGERAFEVNVEHERDGTWHETSIVEEPEVLLGAVADPSLRAELVQRWRAKLLG